VADYKIQVTADAQKAKAELEKVDKVANKVEKPRKINVLLDGPEKIAESFKKLKEDVKEAAETIKQLYGVTKQIPEVGERVQEVEDLVVGTKELAKEAPVAAEGLIEGSKASNILSTSTKVATESARGLIDNLARVGIAIFAVKESVNILQIAYQGLFNETIGREIRLQETILKTQTALASTGKVFRDGVQLTDPLEKIETLTTQIDDHIESIRTRSLELAGVTSEGVIEVFGIVAQQVQQIGGGLKDAEDLAIQFSAALGTFGLPLYQARQEIGSILRGDITMDSYLAKSLGITNEDIRKAKGSAEGIIGFLEKRLEASVAGQSIAAKSFSGVTSNIVEIFEEVNRAFGKGLLQPLLDGLTSIYNTLFSIFNKLKDVASTAGKAVGKLLTIASVGITGGIIKNFKTELWEAAYDFEKQLRKGAKVLTKDLFESLAPLRHIFKQITQIVTSLGAGFGNLALGFIDISIEQFKTLVQVISNLSGAITAAVSAFSWFLKIQGDFLKLPITQYFAQLSTTLKALEFVGIPRLVKIITGLIGLVGNWRPIFAGIGNIYNTITTTLSKILRAIQQFAANVSAILKGLSGTIVQTTAYTVVQTKQLTGALDTTAITLSNVSNEAGETAEKMNKAAASSGRLGKFFKTKVLGFLLPFAKFFAVQFAVIALIDLFARFQRRSEKINQKRSAEEALDRLKDSSDDATESLTGAERALRELDRAKVETAFSTAKEDVKKLQEEIKKLEAVKNSAFSRLPSDSIFSPIPTEVNELIDKALVTFYDMAIDKRKKDLEKLLET